MGTSTQQKLQWESHVVDPQASSLQTETREKGHFGSSVCFSGHGFNASSASPLSAGRPQRQRMPPMAGTLLRGLVRLGICMHLRSLARSGHKALRRKGAKPHTWTSPKTGPQGPQVHPKRTWTRRQPTCRKGSHNPGCAPALGAVQALVESPLQALCMN